MKGLNELCGVQIARKKKKITIGGKLIFLFLSLSSFYGVGIALCYTSMIQECCPLSHSESEKVKLELCPLAALAMVHEIPLSIFPSSASASDGLFIMRK